MKGLNTGFSKKQSFEDVKKTFSLMIMATILLGGFAFTPETSAQALIACEPIGNFFDSIQKILSVASIAIVTIAIIFAGYQIAFAHKRISDVAPILIGGVLIGGAGQIAGMLLSGGGSDANADCKDLSILVINFTQYMA